MGTMYRIYLKKVNEEKINKSISDKASKIGIEVLDLNYDYETQLARFKVRKNKIVSGGDVETFPGNCGWLVLHDLSDYVDYLKLQLEFVEIIAEVLRFSGVFISHKSFFAHFKITEKAGFKEILQDYNPHSRNNIKCYYKSLKEEN